MTAPAADLDPKELKNAWNRLCSSGTASPTIARFLQVGIKPFLSAFESHYLGAGNEARGSKLILGMNGEGKTHLLYCLRELALRNGHAVALLEPKTAAVGDSAFVFAQEVLRRAETSELREGDEDALRIPVLLRAAVERKRAATVAKNLEPETILPRWIDGLRNKDLHPFGLATAIADGLEAAIDDHPERLRDAGARIDFEDPVPRAACAFDGHNVVARDEREVLPGKEEDVLLPFGEDVRLLGFPLLPRKRHDVEAVHGEAEARRRFEAEEYILILRQGKGGREMARQPVRVYREAPGGNDPFLLCLKREGEWQFRSCNHRASAPRL